MGALFQVLALLLAAGGGDFLRFVRAQSIDMTGPALTLTDRTISEALQIPNTVTKLSIERCRFLKSVTVNVASPRAAAALITISETSFSESLTIAGAVESNPIIASLTIDGCLFSGVLEIVSVTFREKSEESGGSGLLRLTGTTMDNGALIRDTHFQKGSRLLVQAVVANNPAASPMFEMRQTVLDDTVNVTFVDVRYTSVTTGYSPGRRAAVFFQGSNVSGASFHFRDFVVNVVTGVSWEGHDCYAIAFNGGSLASSMISVSMVKISIRYSQFVRTPGLLFANCGGSEIAIFDSDIAMGVVVTGQVASFTVANVTFPGGGGVRLRAAAAEVVPRPVALMRVALRNVSLSGDGLGELRITGASISDFVALALMAHSVAIETSTITGSFLVDGFSVGTNAPMVGFGLLQSTVQQAEMTLRNVKFVSVDVGYSPGIRAAVRFVDSNVSTSTLLFQDVGVTIQTGVSWEGHDNFAIAFHGGSLATSTVTVSASSLNTKWNPHVRTPALLFSNCVDTDIVIRDSSVGMGTIVTGQPASLTVENVTELDGDGFVLSLTSNRSVRIVLNAVTVKGSGEGGMFITGATIAGLVAIDISMQGPRGLKIEKSTITGTVTVDRLAVSSVAPVVGFAVTDSTVVAGVTISLRDVQFESICRSHSPGLRAAVRFVKNNVSASTFLFHAIQAAIEAGVSWEGHDNYAIAFDGGSLATSTITVSASSLDTRWFPFVRTPALLFSNCHDMNIVIRDTYVGMGTIVTGHLTSFSATNVTVSAGNGFQLSLNGNGSMPTDVTFRDVEMEAAAGGVTLSGASLGRLSLTRVELQGAQGFLVDRSFFLAGGIYVDGLYVHSALPVVAFAVSDSTLLGTVVTMRNTTVVLITHEYVPGVRAAVRFTASRIADALISLASMNVMIQTSANWPDHDNYAIAFDNAGTIASTTIDISNSSLLSRWNGRVQTPALLFSNCNDTMIRMVNTSLEMEIIVIGHINAFELKGVVSRSGSMKLLLWKNALRPLTLSVNDLVMTGPVCGIIVRNAAVKLIAWEGSVFLCPGGLGLEACTFDSARVSMTDVVSVTSSPSTMIRVVDCHIDQTGIAVRGLVATLKTSTHDPGVRAAVRVTSTVVSASAFYFADMNVMIQTSASWPDHDNYAIAFDGAGTIASTTIDISNSSLLPRWNGMARTPALLFSHCNDTMIRISDTTLGMACRISGHVPVFSVSNVVMDTPDDGFVLMGPSTAAVAFIRVLSFVDVRIRQSVNALRIERVTFVGPILFRGCDFKTVTSIVVIRESFFAKTDLRVIGTSLDVATFGRGDVRCDIISLELCTSGTPFPVAPSPVAAPSAVAAGSGGKFMLFFESSRITLVNQPNWQSSTVSSLLYGGLPKMDPSMLSISNMSIINTTLSGGAQMAISPSLDNVSSPPIRVGQFVLDHVQMFAGRNVRTLSDYLGAWQPATDVLFRCVQFQSRIVTATMAFPTPSANLALWDAPECSVCQILLDCMPQNTVSVIGNWSEGSCVCTCIKDRYFRPPRCEPVPSRTASVSATLIKFSRTASPALRSTLSVSLDRTVTPVVSLATHHTPISGSNEPSTSSTGSTKHDAGTPLPVTSFVTPRRNHTKSVSLQLQNDTLRVVTTTTPPPTAAVQKLAAEVPPAATVAQSLAFTAAGVSFMGGSSDGGGDMAALALFQQLNCGASGSGAAATDALLVPWSLGARDDGGGIAGSLVLLVIATAVNLAIVVLRPMVLASAARRATENRGDAPIDGGCMTVVDKAASGYFPVVLWKVFAFLHQGLVSESITVLKKEGNSTAAKVMAVVGLLVAAVGPSFAGYWVQLRSTASFLHRPAWLSRSSVPVGASSLITPVGIWVCRRDATTLLEGSDAVWRFLFNSFRQHPALALFVVLPFLRSFLVAIVVMLLPPSCEMQISLLITVFVVTAGLTTGCRAARFPLMNLFPAVTAVASVLVLSTGLPAFQRSAALTALSSWSLASTGLFTAAAMCSSVGLRMLERRWLRGIDVECLLPGPDATEAGRGNEADSVLLTNQNPLLAMPVHEEGPPSRVAPDSPPGSVTKAKKFHRAGTLRV